MFTETNPYKRYRQTQVETAGPLELIIMLYDGAIRFGNQAKVAIEGKNYGEANRLIQRVQAIVDELNFSLNMDAGEIAVNLRNLYDFIMAKLVEANVKKDIAIIDQTVHLLSELRGSWAQLQSPQKKVALAGE
ncbi:MAG: flagellar export chaperone FliS [Firmicutes bacterium]|nr:flagellar export chaperone FliS [Bacillota bacterium]